MKIFDTDQHLNDQEVELIKAAGLKRKRVMPTDGWHREKSEVSDQVLAILKDRNAYFERFNVEYAALYPTRSLSHAMILEPEVSIGILEAYNDYALSCSAQMPGKLLPIALSSVHDIDYTASRLEAYKRSGFKGLLLLPHGHNKLFGHPSFFKLYEECMQLELPITLHPNSFGGVGGEGCTSFEEFHTLTFPFSVIKQFASMMFGGVFEKFPGLSFLILEAGAGWLPFWLDRMDNEFEMRYKDVGIKSKPSEILGESKVYISASGFDRDLETVNSMLGGGVVWGSDYPHWDAEIPDSQDELLNNCPVSIRDEVFSKNGRHCFYFPTEV